MRKFLFILSLITITQSVSAQKVDSIYFHLYTDSLKKGFYNYINIDGKMSDGSWTPLTTKELTLTANTGRFQGNDLFIDSSYTGETVWVKAILKSNPAIWKEVTIYIRKRGFDEPLKSSDDIINEMRSKGKKPKQRIV